MKKKTLQEEKKKNRRLNVLREIILQGFPGGLAGKNLSANIRDTGDVSLILSGRSPGGGSGNLLQYSCLEISMDRRALWATIHWAVFLPGNFHGQKSPVGYNPLGCKELDMTEQQNTQAHKW